MDGRCLSSVVTSQFEVHAPFGGIVPELASRSHLRDVCAVVRRALAEADLEWGDVDAIAVTEGPGLVGALLVGVQVARGLAYARDLPLVGVHHMEGHLFSCVLGDGEESPRPFEPHLALLVSGGHTELVDVAGLGRYRIVGSTRDDAVGEAYDKVAKLLGLGYPGGPVIDRLAARGDPSAHRFPRAMMDQDNLDFSLAGLKTAVLVHVDREGQPTDAEALYDICASFQAAVVDVLVHKCERARKRLGHSRVHVAGGVAANAGLRMSMAAVADREAFELRVPPMRYCGDNAAMIACAGEARLVAGLASPPILEANVPLDAPRLAHR
jgi:N6-L-threonylcarbamoyladenine synthase